VRFQQHREASCYQVFFPLQGKVPKEIHAILMETLGEHAPSYANVKNWVTQIKRGDFSTCDGKERKNRRQHNAQYKDCCDKACVKVPIQAASVV
jgi:hypothetical protein